MIEFGNFYQLIAKIISPTGWKTLPAQIAARQRMSSSMAFKQWSNAVEFLLKLRPGGWIYCTVSRREKRNAVSEGQLKAY